MTFSEKMKQKAKDLQHTLVLPEGTETRTIEAAGHIVREKLSSAVYLLGDEQAVKQKAGDSGLSLEGINVVDPTSSDKLEKYAQEYHELRKHKGLTLEEARKQIVDPLKWGAMMVRLDDAQAMVAGAEHATGDVLVAAFTIIKTKPGTKYASSCFVMCTEKRELGVDGQFVFSDCATIPEPNAEQLSEIASAAADSCQTFLDAEPVVAMLSFSTKGSASHPLVDNVTQALEMVKNKRPDLQVDGELQVDAAIIESVGTKKAPKSSVAGKANVLVFPDLQSGNIGYKLVQRLAGAEAYGPILQGFAKPVSDLSRGCCVEDIVVTSAITLAQSGQ